MQNELERETLRRSRLRWRKSKHITDKIESPCQFCGDLGWIHAAESDEDVLCLCRLRRKEGLLSYRYRELSSPSTELQAYTLDELEVRPPA